MFITGSMTPAMVLLLLAAIVEEILASTRAVRSERIHFPPAAPVAEARLVTIAFVCGRGRAATAPFFRLTAPMEFVASIPFAIIIAANKRAIAALVKLLHLVLAFRISSTTHFASSKFVVAHLPHAPVSARDFVGFSVPDRALGVFQFAHDTHRAMLDAHLVLIPFATAVRAPEQDEILVLEEAGLLRASIVAAVASRSSARLAVSASVDCRPECIEALLAHLPLRMIAMFRHAVAERLRTSFARASEPELRRWHIDGTVPHLEASDDAALGPRGSVSLPIPVIRVPLLDPSVRDGVASPVRRFLDVEVACA
jgi:hypothetical protein